MFMIAIAAYLALAIYARSRNKTAGNIMLILFYLAADAFASFIAYVFVYWGIFGPFADMNVSFILVFAGIQIVTAALILLTLGKIKDRKVGRVAAPIAGVWALFAAAYAASVLITTNTPSISEDSRFDIWYDYAPYKEGDSRLATLDEPPTLKLEGDLPVMDGATALFPVYSAFAQALYDKDQLIEEDGGVNYELLSCSTTAFAYDSIVDGTADIIFVAGASKEQMEYAKEMGVELIFTPIGKEAFVFIVNDKNPLDNITVSQVRDIYSGRITQWKELGIRWLGDIRAFQREEGSGSQTAFRQVMGDTEIMPPSETIELVDMMSGVYENVADYRNHRNAIGYTFRFYATQMFDGSGVKLLSLEGIAPTEENIRNNTYPVTGEFYAVTRSDADENTRALVEWVQGEQGQRLIEETGYTPIN